MRVLTATARTQGIRPDDYCFTIEGELVRLPFLECACPDCGCTRGFAGMTSHRATTTALVVDRPELHVEVYRSLLRDEILGAGCPADDPDLDRSIADEVDHLRRLADAFAVGSVLERRLGITWVRTAGVELPR